MTKTEKDTLERVIGEQVARTMNDNRINEAKRRRDAKIDRLTECAMKRLQRKGKKINQKDIAETIYKTLKESRYGETLTPQQIRAEYDNLRSHSIMAPDESCELGFVYDPNTNELYAGYISNTGCNKQWVIDYDVDFSMDENIQALYDKICDEGEWQQAEQ